MSGSLRDMYVGIQFDDGASKTIDRIDKKMDELERGFIKFGTKVDKSRTGLQAMGKVGINATNQLEQGFNRSEKEAKSFKREVKNSDNALSGLKRMAMGIGSVIAGAFAVDKIKDFSISAIELAAGTKALNSQFDQVFTGIQDTATTSLNDIAKQTGVLPDRLKGSFVQMAAFAKTTGVDTAAALSLTERATLAAADSAAFYDRSIEDVTENLQSFLKGNFENDAALGISATETTRNAKANELYGKSFTKLSEAQKQLTLLAMVEDGNKLSGALGQASRESDGFENQVGNLKAAWDGLKGTMATPFLETVTGGLETLTTKLQGVDAEQLGIQFKNGFDKVMDVAVPTFNAIKTGLGWVIDNGPGIISVTAGIASGFATFKVITVVSAGVTALSTALAVYRTAGIAAAAAQVGLNTAMLASPITWVAVGVGALVAAGIYLYKNFDTVKEKAEGLWTKLRENPMMALVAGPIGAVIAGGISLYNNWDTIKAKAGELWATATEKFAGIKQSVSDFVQPAIGWFDSLSAKWNDFKTAISNFKVPEWMSSIGGAISSGISKVKSWVGADGSHATGLASVPFDNYRANLHQGESVLTADQSSTLRGLGVLSSNSDGTPKVDTTPLVSPVTVSTPVGTNGSGNTIQISVPIELIIQGNADDAAIQKLLSMLPAEVKRIFEEIFREKLAGIGG